MLTTSDGESVYATFEQVETEVQSNPNTFSLTVEGADPSEWQRFLERKQAEAKARIDEFCDRDFEDHPDDTVTLDGGLSTSRFVDLPTPARTVSEVRVGGSVIPSEEYRLLKDADQLLRLDADGDPDTWATGHGNIEVDLDWGYTDPPADVAAAEAKLVANVVANLAQMREGLVVEQDDTDLQVSLPSAMTPEIRAILRPHRETTHGATIL